MVILSSCGFQVKNKCAELNKLIKNKKVFIATNAIERPFYREKYINQTKENIIVDVSRLDEGVINIENAQKFIDYYDCIYLAGGNIKLLSEMFSNNAIKKQFLKFIDLGKILITEGEASLILLNSLDYLDVINSYLSDEDKIFKDVECLTINTLGVSSEKIIIHSDKISSQYKGACRFAENKNRISLTYLKDGNFIVI